MLSVQLGLLPDECPSTSPRGVSVTFSSTLASEERELRLVAIVSDDSLRVRC